MFSNLDDFSKDFLVDGSKRLRRRHLLDRIGKERSHSPRLVQCKLSLGNTAVPGWASTYQAQPGLTCMLLLARQKPVHPAVA
jgi:hypothetical protein